MGKKQGEAHFSKSQLLNSRQYDPSQKDVLNALLADDKSYTAAEANQILEQFATKEVV